ncbi:MAG: S8 family serine peptidase [bacterium]|nr:S8 family serine peptidase [bacterium]
MPRGPWAARRTQSANVLADRVGLDRIFLLELRRDQAVHAAVADLSSDPDIEWAQPNYIARASYVPNDPYFGTSGAWGQTEGDLWGLDQIDVETAWDTTLGQGVVVAVVDSGVDFDHPDLAANAWVNPGEDLDSSGVIEPNEIDGIDNDGNGYIDDFYGFDFVRSRDGNGDGDYVDAEDDNEAYPLDVSGHGTHVAGTIAAVADNATGIVGVAPEAQVMGVRGLDAGGSGNIYGLAQSIVYATNMGARVINNSWGCQGCPVNPVVEDAVRFAHGLDTIVVFAAGNDSLSASQASPQNMAETVTVSASTPTDAATAFTNSGVLVDVAAPGGGDGTIQDPTTLNILSLVSGPSLTNPQSTYVVGQDYIRYRGTSMAAPHVAGLAALLVAQDPLISNEEVRQTLRLESAPIAPALGFGRIDADDALAFPSVSEVILETPVDRNVNGIVVLDGSVDGTLLHNAQFEVGVGEEPATFDPWWVSWTWSPGPLQAAFDSNALPDGPAVARLSVWDQAEIVESSTYLNIDNVRITAPVAFATVGGTVDIEFETGSSTVQTIELTLFDPATGATTILYSDTSPTSSSFTIPLDTTTLADTYITQFGQVSFTFPVVTLTVTADSGNGTTFTDESVLPLVVANGEITSPGNRIASSATFDVVGDAVQPYAIDVRWDDGPWQQVATGAGGPFTHPVNLASMGIDVDASDLVELRLLGDLDGDGFWQDGEFLDYVAVVVGDDQKPGWPQTAAESVYVPELAVGDIDDDGDDEIVTLGTSWPKALSSGFYSGVPTLVSAWQGDGTYLQLLADGTGDSQFVQFRTSQPVLGDLDGDSTNDVIWKSFGDIYASANDGSITPGFSSPGYNDGADYFQFLTRHDDPNYRMVDHETPIFFTSDSGDERILVGLIRYDLTGPIVSPTILPRPLHLAENRIVLHDESGSVVADRDLGPGLADSEQTRFRTVADLDRDGTLEIAVTDRPFPTGTHTNPGRIQILDGATLATETTILPDGGAVRWLSSADVDGDEDLELIFYTQRKNDSVTGLEPYALQAYHHDGTLVNGFPRPMPDTNTNIVAIALADLDYDGDFEIVYSSNDFTQGIRELVAIDVDGSGAGVVSGWPVAVTDRASFVRELRAADVDSVPGDEVLYLGESSPQIPFGYGSTALTTTVQTFVEVLNGDGTLYQGGFRRHTPALGGHLARFAVGDVDGSGPPELVIASASVAADLTTKTDVSVYSLDGPGRAAGPTWGNLFGNVRRDASTPDRDRDGVPDHVDNCLTIANGHAEGIYQYDADADGIGNACDPDLNQDTHTTTQDFTPFNDCFVGNLPPTDPICQAADFNGDTVVTTADYPTFHSYFTSNPSTPGPSGLWCADATGATAPCEL